MDQHDVAVVQALLPTLENRQILASSGRADALRYARSATAKLTEPVEARYFGFFFFFRPSSQSGNIIGVLQQRLRRQSARVDGVDAILLHPSRGRHGAVQRPHRGRDRPLQTGRERLERGRRRRTRRRHRRFGCWVRHSFSFTTLSSSYILLVCVLINRQR